MNLVVPAEWQGTKPEYYVSWALGKLREPYEHEPDAPFYLPAKNVALTIESGFDIESLARLELEASGVRITGLREEQVLDNPIRYVKEAIK